MDLTKENKVGSRTVDLLWTGGWDSTFRLLYLVFHLKKMVQPHYIVDTGRKTSILEIKTMSDIRRAIHEKDPAAAGLIKPLLLTSIHEIPQDQAITKKYLRLASQVHLGTQYEWLARYAADNSPKQIEMCLHGENFIEFLRAYLVLNTENPENPYKEMIGVDADEDIAIFTYFSYPLLGIPKLEMEEIARKYGFDDILQLTWFCHSPVKDQPCGLCHPCRIALDEGMTARFPHSAIRRNKWHFNPLVQGTKRVFRSVPRIIKKYTKLLFRSVTGKAFLF
jgi:hypothetical protein